MATSATIGHVEPFKVGTDDWEQCEERMRQYFLAKGIEGDRKVAVFLTMVGSEAYSLLSNLLAPTKPSTKTYELLVEAMTKHLKPKTLVIAEQFKFHQRVQREQETVSEFMVELRKLANKCAFGGYLEEALRDRLVCGVRNQAIQKKLLAESGFTLQRAYETAHGMEAAATSMDPELSKVLRYCHDGWPTQVAEALQPYSRKQDEMSIEAGCLFRGTQVIIPAKLRAQVLRELHTSHPGIVRMKGLARSRVWWPGLATQIGKMVQSSWSLQSTRCSSLEHELTQLEPVWRTLFLISCSLCILSQGVLAHGQGLRGTGAGLLRWLWQALQPR